MYWQQTVFLPIYLDDLYENVNSPNKIHVIFLFTFLFKRRFKLFSSSQFSILFGRYVTV
jgi:hypothetical protein